MFFYYLPRLKAKRPPSESGLAFLLLSLLPLNASTGHTSSPAVGGTPMSVRAGIPGLPFGSRPLQRAKSLAP
jgi:hypothetical protein